MKTKTILIITGVVAAGAAAWFFLRKKPAPVVDSATAIKAKVEEKITTKNAKAAQTQMLIDNGILKR